MSSEFLRNILRCVCRNCAWELIGERRKEMHWTKRGNTEGGGGKQRKSREREDIVLFYKRLFIMHC